MKDNWLKKGVRLLEERPGDGSLVERHKYYVIATRIMLSRGEVIAPKAAQSHTLDEHLKVRDDGFLETRIRIDRENLIGGLFYAVQGMRIGGFRKVEIAPHLAYGEQGIPGVIPPNALLTVELEVIRQLD